MALHGMSLLYEPLSQTLPSFDLYMPRLFELHHLQKLKAKLTHFKEQLFTLKSLKQAQKRLGHCSSLMFDLRTEGEWGQLRTKLSHSIDDLCHYIEEAQGGARGIWILGV